jgi:hypothetical protein
MRRCSPDSASGHDRGDVHDRPDDRSPGSRAGAAGDHASDLPRVGPDVLVGHDPGFVMGYLLTPVAGFLAGLGMLRSRVFSRVALFIPTIGVPLSILSGVILIVCYLLIGWRLAHMRGGPAVTEV